MHTRHFRKRFSRSKAIKNITTLVEACFQRISPTCRVFIMPQGDDDYTLVCTIWDYDYGYSDIFFLDLDSWVEGAFYNLNRAVATTHSMSEIRVVGLFMSRFMDHVAHLGTADDFSAVLAIFRKNWKDYAYVFQTGATGLRVTQASWPLTYEECEQRLHAWMRGDGEFAEDFSQGGRLQ